MNRRVFHRKEERLNNDRFISSRMNMGISKSKYQMFSIEPAWKDETIFDYRSHGWKKSKYIHRVNNSFPELNDSRVLFSSSANRKNIMIDDEYNNGCTKSNVPSYNAWPCRPRKKSYLIDADHVLDLPLYKKSEGKETVDWSSSNILAAALGSIIYLWTYNTSKVSAIADSCQTLCCKFNPSGDKIVASNPLGYIKIFDVSILKVYSTSKCDCIVIEDDSSSSNSIPYVKKCYVTCMSWSPTGESLAVGCCLGAIASYTKNLEVISRVRRAHFDTTGITSIKISPNARFVASCAIDNDVIIWNWPEIHIYHRIFMNFLSHKISWHPWRPSFLAIGATRSDENDDEDPTLLGTFDVAPLKIRPLKTPVCAASIDCMEFSSITGELVASFTTLQADTMRHKSSLVVLSSENESVECVTENDSKILTVMFNPDGTKLATTNMSEDLKIWHFLPNNTKKPVQCKDHSKMAVFLDKAEIRKSIR